MNKYIPEDIAIKILSKLPIRSLFRFKSVSKRWLTLISDTHLNLLRTTRMAAAVIQNTEPSQLHLLGSCNGLLLLNLGTHFFLFNPTTSRCKYLFHSETWIYKWYHMYGLCYDPIKDDYLVIVGDLGPPCNPTSAGVFRVNEGTWNEIHLGNYCIYEENLGVVCNGCMHWLLCRPKITDWMCSRKLLSFDPLIEDGFTELALPDNSEDSRFFIGSCGVLWESVLCLIMNDLGEKSVKVMAMWGEDSSWSTVFVITCELVLKQIFKAIRPLCFSKEGELIMLTGESNVVAYCPRKKSSRVVGPAATVAMTFMESVGSVSSLFADKNCFICREIENHVSLLSEFQS